MAPTKPLVAQQVDACHSFMGMSKAGFCELTGELPAGAKEEALQMRATPPLPDPSPGNPVGAGILPAILQAIPHANSEAWNSLSCVHAAKPVALAAPSCDWPRRAVPHILCAQVA